MLFFLNRQSTRYFLDHKYIVVDTKEDERHDGENNDLVASVRSLDQDKYHHNQWSNPYESSNLLSISSQSKQSMMQMGIISFEGIFFHDKNSPQSDPYRIKNYQGQRYDQGSYFRSSDDGEISEGESKEHNPHISH